MDLRLTVTQEPRGAVIHVDGRLAVENVNALEPVVGAVRGDVIFDLSNLVSVDDAGVATLRTLAGQGARLVGASPYLALLLDDERSRQKEPRKTPRRRSGPRR